MSDPVQGMAQQILTERITGDSLTNKKASDTWTLFVFFAGAKAKPLLHRSFGIKLNDKDYKHDAPKLDPGTLLRLGIDPWTMIDAKLTKQHRPDVDMSPFAFAVAMLNEGLDVEAALCTLDWYQDNRENYTGITPVNFWAGDKLICPVIPDEFRDKYPGRRGLKFFGGKLPDDPFTQVPKTQTATRSLPLQSAFFGWLNEGQRLRAFKYANMGTLSRIYLISKTNEGRWDTEVTKTARKLLQTEDDTNPNYSELAVACQLVDNDDLARWITKRKGVRQALFVVREDATERQMVLGLRTLMNSDAARGGLSHHIGRPLAPDEVAEIRSPEIVDFLWSLPWEIVERVANNRDRILAKLIPHVGNVDAKKLRECLTPHKSRKTRQVAITSSGWFTEHYKRTDWLTKMRAALTIYRSACASREELLLQCGGIHRAFLLALPSHTGEYAGNIDQVLGPLSEREWSLRRDFFERLKGLNPDYTMTDALAQLQT